MNSIEEKSEYRLESQCSEMIHFYYGLNMLSGCVLLCICSQTQLVYFKKNAII